MAGKGLNEHHSNVSARKMHADEHDIDLPLVRRLLAAQFPQWVGLPIGPVPSAGTDNAIYRLGDDKAVRLPRVPRAVPQVGKEHRWLPRLAPHLPLAIPTPVGKGRPAEGYPWAWSVYRWLDGETATTAHGADSSDTAAALAEFVVALQRIDPSGAPSFGEDNFFRGAPLALRDGPTRRAIEALRGILDADAATAAWEAALGVAELTSAPVWVHGDLVPGNLLFERGRLSGVIDFGGLGVGDPAYDAMAGWTLFSGESRAIYRAALGADEEAWARGRGWALSFGLIALPYYDKSNPALAGIARHAIDEVLADDERDVI